MHPFQKARRPKWITPTNKQSPIQWWLFNLSSNCTRFSAILQNMFWFNRGSMVSGLSPSRLRSTIFKLIWKMFCMQFVNRRTFHSLKLCILLLLSRDRRLASMSELRGRLRNNPCLDDAFWFHTENPNETSIHFLENFFWHGLKQDRIRNAKGSRYQTNNDWSNH